MATIKQLRQTLRITLLLLVIGVIPTEAISQASAAPLLNPSAFQKTSPAQGASDLNPTVTLQWTVSVGAETYGACINTQPNCQGGDAGYQRVQGTSLTVTLLPGTQYYYQVRSYAGSAITVADGPGTWRPFTTAPLPQQFGKRSPNNGSSNYGSRIRLKWTASVGATGGYAICWSRTPSCPGGDAGFVRVGNVTEVVTNIFNNGLGYYDVAYWQVRAYSAGGKIGADNATWFKVHLYPEIHIP